MSQPSVILSQVSKKFCLDLKRSLWYGLRDLAGELTLRRGGNDALRHKEFWALRDISFELMPGQTLGLVGHNGAGKSTLLKILNGLIKPDQGRVEYRGRVGALIELGAGFSPILTGRENIFVNGAVLGLTRREIESRLDEIIDFAEIGDFIDTPVKNYSSGMKVRLGFSIAACIRPDILLIDEVLSVGDASFRKRCVDRILGFRNTGGAVIFVSHNMVAVESVCDRVMYLDHGQMKMLGDPAEIIEQYELDMMALSRKADEKLPDDQYPQSVEIEEFQVEGGDSDGRLRIGENFRVRFRCRPKVPFKRHGILIGLRSGHTAEHLICVLATYWDDITTPETDQPFEVVCDFKNPQLGPGGYDVVVGVLDNLSGKLGRKWVIPPREYGSFTVGSQGLDQYMKTVSMSHAMTKVPPVLIQHEWTIN